MVSKKLFFTFCIFFSSIVIKAEVRIFAELYKNGIISNESYVLDVDQIVKYTHFKSDLIIEGKVDAIAFDSCVVTIRTLEKEEHTFGGNIGFSKIYEITNQLQVTLKHNQPQKITLDDNEYLILTLVG